MRAFPRCFAPAVAVSKVVTVSPEEAHHLAHVLRLQPGDGVGLFDGMGGEWVGFVQTVTPDVTVEVVDVASPAPEPPVRVTLAVGLLKGAQMDAVVRDATMLGAFAIAPMVTQHVAVSRRAWQAGQALERWHRVALASARQCRRAVIPAIGPVMAFETVLVECGADAIVMCVEPGHLIDAAMAGPGPAPASALVLVGPEGGWATDEVEQAVRCGARLMPLGPRTLRAETAPTVALSVLWTHWGW
jgi:16S rRNA (uracil1498-N3)-methyltransferase